MRLLRLSENGLVLTQDFHARDVPPYAILSHTWGKPDDEVTYADWVDEQTIDKAGYGKIQFCAEQAALDGLEYVWVDSCCINKADMNELSQSINSMFRWYQSAAKCYVYLSDVSTAGDAAALRQSRWFTRAWTLQELLAPASVEFFARDGQQLGDKQTLEAVLHSITGIPRPALRDGAALADFSIEDRFGWTAGRQATLEEDTAYCLLGIFGVFLPLIYGEGRVSAETRLRTAIVDARHASDVLRRPTTNRTWMVPYERNDAFTGRTSELQKLYHALVSGRRRDQTARIVLVGLGGMGKTQVAMEFLFRVRAEHEHILWMTATSGDVLSRSYGEAAEQLGLVARGDAPKGGGSLEKQVHAYLSREDTGPWVLVFDNVDDDVAWFQHACAQSLPRHHRGSIVFTTRSRRVAVKLAGRDVLQMTAMSVADSRQLLANHLVDPDCVEEEEGLAEEDDDVPITTAALLDRLTRLPLAIVQAAMYINANAISFADYVALLDEQEADVIALLSDGFEAEGMYSGANSAAHPVAKTWLISFRQIQQRDGGAADCLAYMACLDARDIPPSLLPPPPSRRAQLEALGLLKGYSFVTQPSSSALINIHRLVHLATRNWLRMRDALTPFADQATAQLADKLLRVTLADRPAWRQYMPHATYVLRQGAWPGDAFPTTEAQLNTVFLVARCGHCLNLEGRYAEAERCLTYTRHVWMLWRGPKHFHTRDAINNLALACEEQGRLDEAVALYLEALGTVREEEAKLQGEGGQDEEQDGRQDGGHGLRHDDRQTAAIWGNLACAYGKQGRIDEAVTEAARMAAAMERVFGLEDPQMLQSLNNLAGFYFDARRWSDAAALHARVLAIRRRVLGIAHADTLISMNNMASALRENGQPEAAEALYAEALDALQAQTDHRASLEQQQQQKPAQDGPGWISTATISGMDRLRSPKAMELRDALNRAMLGDEHPITLASTYDLACLWKGGPRDAEAHAMMQRCLETRKRVLGPRHADTLASSALLKSWDER